MTDILLDPIVQTPSLSTNVPFGTVALVVVAAVAVILFIGLAIAVKKMLFRPELHGLTRDRIKAQWAEIEKLSASGGLGAKMAIVEADKLLDGVLKSMVMHGDTLGERLKFASYKYPELRKVWSAHRLRNQIVHETTFAVSERQAHAAIHEYRHALKSIGVL